MPARAVNRTPAEQAQHEAKLRERKAKEASKRRARKREEASAQQVASHTPSAAPSASSPSPHTNQLREVVLRPSLPRGDTLPPTDPQGLRPRNIQPCPLPEPRPPAADRPTPNVLLPGLLLPCPPSPDAAVPATPIQLPAEVGEEGSGGNTRLNAAALDNDDRNAANPDDNLSAGGGDGGNSDVSAAEDDQRPVSPSHSLAANSLPNDTISEEVAAASEEGHSVFHPPEDTQDESDDEAQDSIPMATPFARQKLAESLRLHGCRCTQTSSVSGRTTADRQNGASLPQVARILQSYAPDVLERVARTDQLPRCDADDPVLLSNWRAMLAGISSRSGGERVPMSFEESCLIRRGAPVNIRRWWDVDALFIPLHSLQAHKGGFRVAYCPRITRVLTQDWRIRIASARIRNLRCKSLYLGHGFEGHGFHTYLFFPNAPVSNASRRKGVPLSQEEQRTWLDQVLLPSLHQVYEANVLQQHPKSFSDAYSRAHARQKENVTAGEKTVAEHHYDLPNPTDVHGAPALSRLWDAVQGRLSLLGPEWQNVQLVTSTYNCKLQYRDQTVAGLRQCVDRGLERYFHLPDLDLRHTYVDLAYEDHASRVKSDGTEEPLIVLRRACCNEADFAELGLGRRSQSFHWQGTADVSSIRATPAWKSALRAGGVAYVQSYNCIKNMFASTDRSTGAIFGEPAFRSLAYSQSSLDTFREMARQPQGARDPHKRQRALQAFRAVIARVDACLTAHERPPPAGYSDRGEYRTCWDLFQSFEPPQDQPSLEPSTHAHWPFYALKVRDVMQYIRWNTNRWLYAICGVLSEPKQEMEEQHRSACMLSALFDCLELTLSSGCVTALSRLAKDRYERKGEPPANPITIGGGTIRIGEEGDAATQDGSVPDGWGAAAGAAAGADPAPTAAHASQTGSLQRGLALLQSLRATNLAWLPDDMFDWPMLRFDPVELGKTAFMTGHFDSQFKWRGKFTQDDAMRRFVDRHLASMPRLLLTEDADETVSPEEELDWIESCRPLYELIFFRYSHWLLAQLSKGRLRLVDDLYDDERWGCYGLSYALIAAATDDEPWITRPLADGSRRRNEGGGFRNFPSNWVTRIQLLFDWGDRFPRKTWDKLPFREWTRYIHQRLTAREGTEWADAWKEHIGRMGQTYLTVLPAYESSKSYTFARPPPRDVSWSPDDRDPEAKAIQWIAAVPWQAPRWEEIPTFPQKWRMMVRGKRNKVPNYLPHLLLHHPEWVSGRRFDLIEDVTSAGRGGRAHPLSAAPVDVGAPGRDDPEAAGDGGAENPA